MHCRGYATLPSYFFPSFSRFTFLNLEAMAASSSDMTIDASIQSEKLNGDPIMEFTQLIREHRQAKAREEELDTELQNHKRHLQLIKGKREAVEEQLEELEARQRQLIEEEGHCVSKRDKLWTDQTKAKDNRNDILTRMLQLKHIHNKFELDKCDEAKTMFREAVENGDAVVMKLLVATVTMNGYEWIPFITASSRGDVDTVKKLLLVGTEADSKDIVFGRTALSWASAGGHTAVVQLLFNTHVAVDVNSQDNDGWTPLRWASERGHEDVVRLLLDRGAQIGYRKTLRGHCQSIRALTFSLDAKFLATGSYEGVIEIWDTATGQCQQTLQHPDVKISPLRREMPLQAVVVRRNVVCSITFTHDSALVISGSSNSSIGVWSRETGDCQRILQDHTSFVQTLALSHDSRLMVSGSNDETIKIWETATGTCQRTLQGHERCVYRVVFSHDSKLIASGAFDGDVKIWDSVTGECLQTLRGRREEEVFTLAFSHDSTRIVSGLNNNIIKIWDVTTGRCPLQTICHDDDVHMVAFSPDSKLVVSRSKKNAIYVWDSTTGKCLRKIQGPDASHDKMAWSKDLKFIASSSYDKGTRGVVTVKLWDDFVLSSVVCPSRKL
ncbi:WD40 repeat-like protein [Trichoderma afarasin]